MDPHTVFETMHAAFDGVSARLHPRSVFPVRQPGPPGTMAVAVTQRAPKAQWGVVDTFDNAFQTFLKRSYPLQTVQRILVRRPPRL